VIAAAQMELSVFSQSFDFLRLVRIPEGMLADGWALD
jgi:hypothetical protein